jgi:DNA-binding response OmpR family regulator
VRTPVPSLALEVDFLRRGVRVDGMPVDLTAIEFDILAALAREPGVLIDRAALLDLVRGPGFVGEDVLVDLRIASLREKLGVGADGQDLVEMVGDSGYRLTSSD